MTGSRVNRIILPVLLILLAFVVMPNAYAQDACPDGICPTSFGLSAAQIAEHPIPAVAALTVDIELLHDRNYRRINGQVPIYDAPDGNTTGTLDAGFNFVTSAAAQNGWVQINPNQWIQESSLGSATVSEFAGVLLTEPLPYPMAWVLVTTRTSRMPGVEAGDSEPLLMRYDRIYLYDSIEIDGWEWYQVGPDQWIHQRNIGRVLPVKRPADVDTNRWISIDLYEQIAVAYEGERPVFATLVASGLPDWSTNEGLFHIYVSYERTAMSGAEGQSDFYFLEEVPWTMYFDNDIGLHGTYWHDGFGYRHSHGCVNLSITDAHWLYQWAEQEFDPNVPDDLGAAVYVYSSGDYS